MEGIHYTEKYSPTPMTASIRMLLTMAAAKDGELRHFDAELAFSKADVNEEIYTEIPEEFQEFPGTVVRLNKVIYGLRTVDKGVDSAWKHTRTRISEPAWTRDDRFQARC